MMFVQLQLEQTKEKRRSQKRSHRTMLAEAVSQPKMTKPNQTPVSVSDESSSSSSLRHAHSRPSTSKGAAAQTSSSPNPAVPSPSRTLTKPPSFAPQSRLPTTPSSSNLSDHAANASSSHSYARDLSRLRLMCPSHQPCVVYSNRELATEIKSIVSATKKAPNSPPIAQNDRAQPAPSSTNTAEVEKSSTHGSQNPPHAATISTSNEPPCSAEITSLSQKQIAENRAKQLPKSSGACLQVRPLPAEKDAAEKTKTTGGALSDDKAYIDSFKAHGPGIFSGTFSGSKYLMFTI